MSGNIKLSPLNQKIIQERKAVNQNNAANNLEVSDNGLKQDTFVRRRKKAIAFGSILGSIGLAIGAAFLAYKGKLGSKAQNFVGGFINKSNKCSDNVPTVTSKATPSASTEKTPISTAVAKIDIQDKVEVSQKPIQEAVQEVIEQPVIDKPVQSIDKSKIAPDIPIETESKVSSSLPTQDNKLSEVKPDTDKVAQEVIPAGTDKIQTEKPVKKAGKTPVISKTTHDISGGAESYEVKLKFRNSDEEITLVLPKNQEAVEYNGSIYSSLKYSYGDGWKNCLIRGLTGDNADAEISRYQKSFSEYIDNLTKGMADNKVPDASNVAKLIIQDNLSTNLSDNARQILGGYLYGIGEVPNLDSKTHEELSIFLNSLKENFSDKIKRAILNDIDRVYSMIDEKITPLQNVHHCYRGIARGTLINTINKNGNSNSYIDFISNFKIGETVVPDNGAMFITGSANGAASYASKDGVLLHIILPKKAKVENCQGDAERLLPPMAKFKVVGNKQVGKDGFRVIDLEYLIDQGTRNL